MAGASPATTMCEYLLPKSRVVAGLRLQGYPAMDMMQKSDGCPLDRRKTDAEDGSANNHRL
jgi:hypothetical protein